MRCVRLWGCRRLLARTSPVERAPWRTCSMRPEPIRPRPGRCSVTWRRRTSKSLGERNGITYGRWTGGPAGTLNIEFDWRFAPTLDAERRARMERAGKSWSLENPGRLRRKRGRKGNRSPPLRRARRQLLHGSDRRRPADRRSSHRRPGRGLGFLEEQCSPPPLLGQR